MGCTSSSMSPTARGGGASCFTWRGSGQFVFVLAIVAYGVMLLVSQRLLHVEPATNAYPINTRSCGARTTTASSGFAWMIGCSTSKQSSANLTDTVSSSLLHGLQFGIGSSAFSVQSREPILSAHSTADVSEPQASRIRIGIYGLRVLIGTILLVGVIAALTFFLTDGLRLAAQEATSMTDASRSKLLDKYNTYSGAFASIVSMPFQTFVAMLLPIFFVSFWTRLVLGNGDSMLAKWAPMATVAAVTWMLGQGMNALNVQFEAAKVEFIISSSDLVSTEGSTEFPFTMSAVTNTATTAGVPSNDTILRAAIKPFSTNEQTSCINGDGVLKNPEPSIRFGFPLNSWLEYMLPESIASDAAFTYTMGVEFSAGEIDASAFPGGNVDDTAVLFSHGYWLLRTSFQDILATTSLQEIYDATKASDATTFLTQTQTFMSNESSDMYLGEFGLSVPDMSVQFASFDISPQITFDTVTFEIPSNASAISADDVNWNHDQSDIGIYSRSISTGCNDNACVLESVAQYNQDQVRMVRICMTEADGSVEDFYAFVHHLTSENADGTLDRFSCPYPSNSSVYVVSIARQFTIEAVDIQQFIISVKNPSIQYSVTVGRLSWESSNLAEVYGATCAAGVNCDGLYFSLSNGQHVVVGDTHLPQPHKLLYPYTFGDWQVLVLSNTLSSETEQGNVFVPGDYPLKTGSLPWTGFSGTDCNHAGSDYLNDVVQRHIYSRDSVQPAYMSALFWLFQNGAVKDIEVAETYSAPAKASSKVKLSFAGNRLWMSPIASIPQTSAWITYGACVLILIMGLLVTFRSFCDQSAIADKLTPHNVAGLIVNSAKYPPLLLRAGVQPENPSDQLKATAATADDDIQSFEITELTLRHRTNDSAQTMVIGQRSAGESA